jgi:uncharacterized protein YrrD
MFRAKDFILMDVIDIKGKKIGFIKDIIIDFNRGFVIGFVVSSYKIFQKTINVLQEHIVSFNKSMVINGYSKCKYITYDEIRNMDIIDRNGEIIGMLEDILFHKFSFKIHGIIISSGLIKNILKGKRILLINGLILGEKSILYYRSNNKIDFTSIPHKLFTEVHYYEKEV